MSEKEILNRIEMLYNIALNVWEYPSTDYVEECAIDNLYSLADDEDFTNTKVKSFVFMGDEHKVKNWTQLYEKICLILYDLEPSTFAKLSKKKFSEECMQKRFSDKEDDLRNSIKISNGLFIEKNLSTESKLSTLRVIFNEYKLDYNELTFYIA